MFLKSTAHTRADSYDFKIIFGLICLIFLVFTLYFVLNKGFAPWRYSLIIAMIGAYCWLQKQSITPNPALIVFCSAGFVCITLNYYLFKRFISFDADNAKFLSRLIDQYAWFLAFLMLPTVFSKAAFKSRHLFLILLACCTIAFGFNAFHNIRLNLQRSEFANFFNPVIDYDLGIMSIAIVTLIMSFQYQNRLGHAAKTIATLTMFAIILHGSRGTWIGIPMVLLLLGITYFKTQPRAFMAVLASFVVFFSVNLAIPSSPINQRMAHSQQEYADMSQNQYQNSTGVRLLLWEQSWHWFQQNPILGMGMDGIERGNCALFEQKKLPQCFQHQHNIVFHEMAAHGILGLLALMATYLSAIIFFFKHSLHQSATVRNLSYAGLAFVLYQFSAGMTEYYLFFINNVYLFYLIVASLMSLIYLKIRDQY